MRVKEVMTRDVITVRADTSVEECSAILLKHNISGLPVVDARDKVVGIVTEGDLIRRAGRIKAPGFLEILGGVVYLGNPGDFVEKLLRAMSLQAGNLMTDKLYSVEPEDTVEKAATIMIDKRVSRLPVLGSDGRIVGIVSRRDIMRTIWANPDNPEE